MTEPAGETAQLLDLLRFGSEDARTRLIEHACERLRRLTRKMLRDYPDLRDNGDILDISWGW
jgi:hypothetical protein